MQLTGSRTQAFEVYRAGTYSLWLVGGRRAWQKDAGIWVSGPMVAVRDAGRRHAPKTSFLCLNCP